MNVGQLVLHGDASNVKGKVEGTEKYSMNGMSTS
jgi:hypothetical protein